MTELNASFQIILDTTALWGLLLVGRLYVIVSFGDKRFAKPGGLSVGLVLSE